MLFRNRFANTPLFMMSPDEPAGGAAAPAGGAAAPAAGAAAAPAAGAAAPAAGGTEPAGGAAAPAAGATPGAAPAAGAAAPAAGAAAAAAAPGAATLAGGAAPKPADGAAPTPATFPETWRKDLASGDAAFEKVLERYTSPKAFADAHRALVAKVSSGELKSVAKAPPEGATPEQVAEWRKEAGLPAEPKGYVDAIKLPTGVVPGEADRPLIDGFAAHAMKSNMPTDAFNTAINWYYENLDAQNKAKAALDNSFAGESARTLEAEWGPEFPANQNRLSTLFADSPEVGDIIYTARDAKGRILGNIPEVCRALTQLHKEAYPAYTPTSRENSGSSAAVATEMAGIEAMMGDPRSKYNEKNSSGQLTEGANTLQARYRDLVSQTEKNKQRAA